MPNMMLALPLSQLLRFKKKKQSTYVFLASLVTDVVVFVSTFHRFLNKTHASCSDSLDSAKYKDHIRSLLFENLTGDLSLLRKDGFWASNKPEFFVLLVKCQLLYKAYAIFSIHRCDSQNI